MSEEQAPYDAGEQTDDPWPSEPARNTDREIYRVRQGDGYADSIHVTEGGGIGINCGGLVHVLPLRGWHALARVSEEESLPLEDRRERGLNDLSAVIQKMWGDRCPRHDGHCACCVAWTVFDMIERLTDSDVIEGK